jgi:hypothetical protein
MATIERGEAEVCPIEKSGLWNSNEKFMNGKS